MGILLRREEDLTGSLSSAVWAASTGMVQREKNSKTQSFLSHTVSLLASD